PDAHRSAGHDHAHERGSLPDWHGGHVLHRARRCGAVRAAAAPAAGTCGEDLESGDAVMRRGVLVAGAAALLSASGCASYYYGDAAGPDTVTPQATAALLKANQQAVDKLLEAAPLEPGARFLVATLVNVDRLGASSRFGRISSEQIAGRLVQRGV